MSNEALQSPGRARGVLAAWLLALAPAAMLVLLLLRPVSAFDSDRSPAFAWLGRAVIAQVQLLAGWNGLRLFDALCWLGGFLTVAAACRQRSGSAAGVLLALAIAFLAALPVAGVGLQSFAALCFGSLLALLRLELRPWQTTVLAVPLFLVWQNLHLSVGVAAIVLAVLAIEGWWQWYRRRAAAPWETTVLAPVAAGTMLATPGGWTVLRMSVAHARAATGVGEWLPLWDSANRFEAVPVLLVAVVTSWVVLRNPRRIDAGELAVAMVLFVMTVFVYRFVLFWAIGLIPLVARAVPPPPVERRLPAMLSPLALLVTAVATPLLHPMPYRPAYVVVP